MRTILCCFLVLFSICCQAQDPNFSQFFTSPLSLNPALTGKIDGSFRVAGNYRNQWPTINKAFTTGTASFDINILKNYIPEFDQFGVGVIALSDQSANGVLQSNYVALSTAYHKALDENGYHQVGLGFQGGWINQRLNVIGNPEVYFEDQLTTSGWTGITNEIFNSADLNVSLFDMNIGLLYNGTTNGDNNIYFGTSIYHVNQPRQSFLGAQYYLKPRVTVQAGGMLPLSSSTAIHISALNSRQEGANNIVFGAAYMLDLSYATDKVTNLYGGLWTRLNNVTDALIPYIGLEWKDLRFGFTYDVNISSLQPGSNMRGGAEFSIIYMKQPNDPFSKKLNCPKF